MGEIVVTTIENGVAKIVLNAPEKLNALGPEMIKALLSALDETAADTSVRALVLTGAGKGFCAGADLSNEFDATPAVRGEHTRQAMHGGFNLIIKKIVDFPAPTIAMVNGVAAGGGYGLALAPDLTIAAESARFVLVFTPQLGLIPDMGASWHASRSLGRAQAMARAFFGDKMSAAEAVEAGLIWRAAPDDALEAEVSAVAQRLAEGPTLAYRQTRLALDRAFSHSLHDQLDYEAETQPKLIATEDLIEGATAFMEKRKPQFKGR